MKRLNLSDYITFKSLYLIVGGSLIFSLAMNLLIVPMALYSGGFLGIAQLIREMMLSMGLSIAHLDIAGIAYFLMNVPLFLISVHSIGKSFFIKTLFAVGCYTLFLTVIVSPPQPIITDRLTCCLIGGVIAGIGAGMTLLSGGCGGGEEILGVYLVKKYPFFTVGKISIIINVFVYGCCMVFFDIEIVVYSLIYSVFTNLFIDKMHFQNIMMNLFIISKKEGICELIIRTTGRGVTHWNGFGGYTDEPTNIYLTVVSKREYRLLRRQIKAFDAESFVVINEDINVLGNFKVRT